jgi:hypothetical protein
MLETIRRGALTLVAFPPSALRLALDSTAPGRVKYKRASEVLASRPSALAVLDGPMYGPGGRLLYKHFDKAAGVDEPGVNPGRGVIIRVLENGTAVASSEARPTDLPAPGAARVAVQLQPELVRDGRAVASGKGNLSERVWRAALCILADGRLAFAVMVASMPDFAAALVAAGATAAGYTDGGGSGEITLRSGERYGHKEDRAVASWLVAEGNAPAAPPAPPSEPAPTPGAIPLPEGRHVYLWQPSKVRDWDETFQQLRHLGFVGVHLHSNGTALRSAITRDLVRRANAAGLYLGASMAMDTGASWQQLADHAVALADLLGPGSSVGLNAETGWNRDGAAADAERFVDSVLERAPEGYCFWLPGWWKPSSHRRFPTRQFDRLVKFHAPQDYYVWHRKDGTDYLAPAQPTPPEYLVAITRREHQALGIKAPEAFSFQATTQADGHRFIGLCFREYPLTIWWHWWRLLEPKHSLALELFRAAAVIDARHPELPAFGDRVRAFQRAHGLEEDGWIGLQTADVARRVGGR